MLSTAVVDDLELITDRQRRLYHQLFSAEMMVHVQAHVGLLVSLLDNAAPDSLPEAALGFFDQARQSAQRSAADPTRSWLTVLAADALARVGRSREALAALDAARSLLAGQDSRTDEWMYDFDEGGLAVHAGTCLLTVGRPESAAAAFTDALRLLPACCERRGAEIQIGLAAARLASGEVEEAQRLTLVALETFAARGSVPGLHRIRELREQFRARGHAGAAGAIDERARALGDRRSVTGSAAGSGVASVDAVQVAGEHVYWIEGRAGGDVLVRSGGLARGEDVLPSGVAVASYVHEYGGGAYLATDNGVWFVRADDQQIWRATQAGLRPVTTAPRHGEDRYADFRLSAPGLLVAVRERHRHGTVTNELVMIPADGSAPAWPVAQGWDFYSFPRPSPDGRALAWTTWRHPLMPWDGSWLWVAEIRKDGTLGAARCVAGGPEESVFQPEWSPGGVLHFVSDRTGWWDLYACPPDGGIVSLVHRESVELGTAQWEFGYSTYAFLDHDRIALLAQRGGATQLSIWDRRQTDVRAVELPYTSIKPYLAAHAREVTMIGAAPDRMPAVVVADIGSGESRELTSAAGVAPGWQAPNPEFVDILARGGGRVYATVYRPQPEKRPAPVIVRAHPGPTSNTPLRLDPWVQFFVGHGFAVLDVDYRGSTGYGRAYRNALRGHWGVLDVSDCVDAVQALGHDGSLDLTRVVISGASAGGYTALRAATDTTKFRAATVRSAIVDPAAWRTAAPKFQSHHADLLLGPASTRQDRSLLRPGITAHCSILAFHGGQDTVTPLRHVRELVAAIGEQVSLVVYPDEGHGLSRPSNIEHARYTELAHYRAALDT